MNRSTAYSALVAALAIIALVVVMTYSLISRALPPGGGTGDPIIIGAVAMYLDSSELLPLPNGYVAKGQSFCVIAEGIVDYDGIGDPDAGYDGIEWVKYYRQIKPLGQNWGTEALVMMDTNPSVENSNYFRSFYQEDDQEVIGSECDVRYRIVVADAGQITDDQTDAEETKEGSVRDVDHVTVTPATGYVAVGHTIELTGHAWDAGDAELAAEFNWTVNPALGDLDPGSGKRSTLAAGASAGTCTVTATHDPSGEPGAATVHVVAVEKMQYNDDGWQDVAGTLHVLKGTTVTFKAAKSELIPSWPAGKPVWGGTSGASGTGETKSVTFSTASSDLSDRKTVTAECGNTVTIEAVVYELTGVTTPVDNFENRNDVNYGIEEEVNLSFTTTPAGITAAQIGGLEWHLAEGGSRGSVTGGADGTGLFDAEASGGSAHLKLEILSGPSRGAGPTVHRNVIEPWGAFTRRRPGTNVWHVQGVCSVGFQMLIHLLPKDVSYDNLEFREGSCWSTANGYLSNLHHIEHATGAWAAVGGGEATNGCEVAAYDTVSVCSYNPNHAQGYFIWPIPWQYRVPGGSAVTWTTMDDEAWTDEAGWAEDRKGDVCESKNLSDPSQEYGEPE